MIGGLAIAVTLVAAALLFHPRLVGSAHWRAISTPLASIIGSGFLVSVPILRDLSGSWATALMAGLLAIAYFVGAAVRHNILHVEPLLSNGQATRPILSLERISHAALAFAYFVSVAYYLVLFSTFLLKPLGIGSGTEIKLIVSACLALIAVVGLSRGFGAEEKLEIYAVSVKLAVIGGLLAALVVYALHHVFTGVVSTIPGHFEVKNVPVLLGLLIVVQGFETSRFLGDAYPAELRVRTMKQAQLLSAVIYLAFFLAMTPLFSVDSKLEGVAAIVDMLAPVAAVLPIMIIVGALASQSSAAIADTLGAGGLVRDVSAKRINIRYAYLLTAAIAALVTWETDIYALIALASRCFAFYYALQCLVAAISAYRLKQTRQAAGFLLLSVVCALIVVFGAPVEGE
ncbi:hypothetical protein [Roseibium aggregatum]|uniref:Uncharacterized protein n=1 Tax=Roseibium aggregatum TaxID=187304 RepID=A0A926S787_9HYPH|nr:hypothetical protein [Roseibium aggregatum]MBD1548020.1 hypothetical protein [Roseibium aggregatum]